MLWTIRHIFPSSFPMPSLLSAAPPATVDESGRYDAATVLVIETSHVRFLPACQGMSE